MKRLALFIIHLSLFIGPVRAQEWTMQQCMEYAVTHNHAVKQAELELDNRKATKTSAIGRFLPVVDAGIGAQYNFGRAIDPETNGYTDVSTFYNGYQLSASLPLFDGFSRLHALKAAKAGELMGRASLRQQQDLTALEVMQAFANVAYYDGLVKMADEKVDETTLLLRQTRLLEEVGRKSAADVAQVASQQAEADYELTRQQNLYASALLELKKAMGFPIGDSLSLSITPRSLLSLTPSPSPKERGVVTFNTDRTIYSPLLGRGAGGEAFGRGAGGEAEEAFGGEAFEASWGEAVARYQMETAKHEWRQARASLFPSLSLSAGLNTTYFKTLHSKTAASFSSQFKNNMGEYIGATLSIPLFNRLQSITAIRKARNNYKIAREAYEQKQLELEKLSREAWQDWQGYLKQTAQMEKKVEADSLAYQLTRRQFEEGLSTAIDLHTTGSQLLQSKATLLQCRLMTMVKAHLVRYYRGERVWE